MTDKTNTSLKLNLDQAVQFFALSPDLIFICKKVFAPSTSLTESQWRETLIKKGVLPQPKNSK